MRTSGVGILVLSVLSPAAATAQNAVVSPAGFEAQEGSLWEFWPWIDSGRRQQVHGDLRGRAITINGLAWRRDGGRSFEPRSVARTLDAELGIGDADFEAVGGAFSGNYVAPRVIAYTRKPLNLPDWTQPQGRPAPFTAVVPFDVPFPFGGTRDVAWDLRVFGTTVRDYYFVDLHTDQNVRSGMTGFHGAGCRVGGTGIPLLLDAQVSTSTRPDRLRLAWQCSNLPSAPGNPSAFVFGISNPSLPLPGGCTSLYVDPLVTVTAPAVAGVMRLDVIVPFQPTLIGSSVFAQGVAADATQPGLPLVLSNGSVSTVPPLPTPMRVHSVTSYYDASALTGPVSAFTGVVVEFRH